MSKQRINAIQMDGALVRFPELSDEDLTYLIALAEEELETRSQDSMKETI